jgi:hypothetical protein
MLTIVFASSGLWVHRMPVMSALGHVWTSKAHSEARRWAVLCIGASSPIEASAPVLLTGEASRVVVTAAMAAAVWA